MDHLSNFVNKKTFIELSYFHSFFLFFLAGILISPQRFFSLLLILGMIIHKVISDFLLRRP